MNYKTIQLAYDSGVATITLNRPDKRNAISFELIDDLLGALEEVETSDALVLILTGAGKAFCSGMDLENLKALLGRSPEAEPEGFGDDGPAVPFALRISQSHDCGGERRGHRRWHRTGLAVRLHTGCAGSQVRLHRSAHRLCSRHRFHFPAASGRRKAGPRSFVDRTGFSARKKRRAWDWSTKSSRRRI